MVDPVQSELLRLRASIDNMDAALVHLLAERFKITQQVGELKAPLGLPPAILYGRRSRSPGSGRWPKRPGWIRRSSPRSFWASSSLRWSVTTRP